jgi:hypothetical protein
LTDAIQLAAIERPPVEAVVSAATFLLQHAADQIPADVGRRSFLRHGMATEIEQILENVREDEGLWELLGGAPPDLPFRVEALRAAIHASAELP